MEQSQRRKGIRGLPENERPRERLAQRGESALNSSELLAILLRVGVAGMSAVELGRKLFHFTLIPLMYYFNNFFSILIEKLSCLI